MSSPHDAFAAGFQAAELAGLAAYSRAVFLSASVACPDVVGMVLRVRIDEGLSVIEAEYLDREGHAVGGFGA